MSLRSFFTAEARRRGVKFFTAEARRRGGGKNLPLRLRVSAVKKNHVIRTLAAK